MEHRPVHIPPIVARHARPDFAEVLKSQTDNEINRVFTIYFPDKETRQQFFSAESYKAIKAEFFESSVASTTLIAEYNRET